MLYPTFFTIQKEEKAIVCDHLFLFLHLFYFDSETFYIIESNSIILSAFHPFHY